MRVFVGAIIWLAIGACCIIGGREYFARSGNATNQLTQYLTQSRTAVELKFDSDVVLCVGDPIVSYSESGIATIIGKIQQLESRDSTDMSPAYTSTAFAEFYSTAGPIREGDHLSYHNTPDSMDWVVQMMLPPKTRKKITDLIVNSYQSHQAEIVSLMAPIVEKSVHQAAVVIREEFQRSVHARQEQIQILGDRYRTQVVDQRIIPLVQDEIWPVIQEEGQPLATVIGQEIWQQASVWRFGWRMLYDKMPLPEKNLAQKEFDKFLETKAIPILESHVPDIIETQQRIIKKVAANEKVREVAADVVQDVARDPEFQMLVGDILKDIFVNNDRVKKIIQENWNSAEARRAMAITNSRIDPTITQIGSIIFGSPDQQITPEFSRVLRNKILNKDDRWLVLHSTDSNAAELTSPILLNVKRGSTNTQNPFHVQAEEAR